LSSHRARHLGGRVTFSATFDNAKEALVFAAPSTFRPDVSGPGYWVFTPARLADGKIVTVNRGFVPERRQDAKTLLRGQMPRQRLRASQTT
jgi:cytochrome oxidase assembly protein ShyY1